MNDLKSILGLFWPMKWTNKETGQEYYSPTIGIADIPLGIYIILIAIIVNLIMKYV